MQDRSDILKDLWFGPMPVNMFFNQFMPIRGALSTILLRDDYFSSVPLAISRNVDSERRMSSKFLQLIRAAAVHSGAKLDTKMEYLIECRHGHGNPCDPFELHPLDTVDEEITASDNFQDSGGRHPHPYHLFDCNCLDFCRGKISARIGRWFAIQPRTHGFMLYIGDPWVRLIRVDRAGAVFSERFNFRKTSSFLLSYISRFSNMTPEATGLDMTTRAPTWMEMRLARKYLPQLQGSSENTEPTMVIKIPDRESGGMREVVSCRPSNHSAKLTGRATQAWPVYDLKIRQVVFFKEAWRSLEKGMQKESSILAKLNEAGIQHVPQLICGGDMEGRWFTTKTQLYQEARWNLTRTYQIAPRILHRLIEDLIGIHLEHFGSTRYLLRAVYDAFIAHRDAYKICNILHCDISSRNILMDGAGHGFLNDWDMAKTLDTLGHSSSSVSVGTWRFMSLGLVLDQKKRNDVHDDIESFFYLVVYFVLRYGRHNKANKTQVEDLITSVFDDPRGKLAIGDHLTSNWEITQNEPMNQWLHHAGEAVKEWTKHWRQEKEKYDEQEERRGKLKDHDYFVYLFERFLDSEQYALAWPDSTDDAAQDCLQ